MSDINSVNYEAIIREKLGDKRFNHSVNVAETCVKLAEKHGGDKEKAYIAGVLHDIMKDVVKSQASEVSRLIVEKEKRLKVDGAEVITPALWHAIIGAIYIRDELNIKDEDILNAVRFHTIGRANMSLLEKIVYLGDLVSVDRSFDGVEEYRKYAFDNLDYAVYAGLKLEIKTTLSKDGLIPAYTFEAYNFYHKFKDL